MPKRICASRARFGCSLPHRITRLSEVETTGCNGCLLRAFPFSLADSRNLAYHHAAVCRIAHRIYTFIAVALITLNPRHADNYGDWALQIGLRDRTRRDNTIIDMQMYILPSGDGMAASLRDLV